MRYVVLNWNLVWSCEEGGWFYFWQFSSKILLSRACLGQQSRIIPSSNKTQRKNSSPLLLLKPSQTSCVDGFIAVEPPNKLRQEILLTLLQVVFTKAWKKDKKVSKLQDKVNPKTGMHQHFQSFLPFLVSPNFSLLSAHFHDTKRMITECKDVPFAYILYTCT